MSLYWEQERRDAQQALERGTDTFYQLVLKYKEHHYLSNLPLLWRPKWKFDIPQLYKGNMPPGEFRGFSFSEERKGH